MGKKEYVAEYVQNSKVLAKDSFLQHIHIVVISRKLRGEINNPYCALNRPSNTYQILLTIKKHLAKRNYHLVAIISQCFVIRYEGLSPRHMCAMKALCNLKAMRRNIA